ncbi:MAG: hypothetical protein RLO50_15525 [Azospirillaceae bacterium]
MEKIRLAAEHSTRRGLGFAALAIVVTMLGLSFYPALALKTGAALLLITAAILYFKAHIAPGRNVRDTEVWLMIGDRIDMPAEAAQRVIGRVLQELYRRYAAWTVAAAGATWLCGLVAGVVFEPQAL